MKKLTALIFALALAGVAGPAFAQSNDDRPTQFIPFEHGSEFEGGVKVPGGTLYGQDKPIGFSPLLKLERSFMPELEKSSQDSALN